MAAKVRCVGRYRRTRISAGVIGVASTPRGTCSASVTCSSAASSASRTSPSGTSTSNSIASRVSTRASPTSPRSRNVRARKIRASMEIHGATVASIDSRNSACFPSERASTRMATSSVHERCDRERDAHGGALAELEALDDRVETPYEPLRRFPVVVVARRARQAGPSTAPPRRATLIAPSSSPSSRRSRASTFLPMDRERSPLDVARDCPVGTPDAVELVRQRRIGAGRLDAVAAHQRPEQRGRGCDGAAVRELARRLRSRSPPMPSTEAPACCLL